MAKRKAVELDDDTPLSDTESYSKQRKWSRNFGEELIDGANRLYANDFQRAYIPDELLSHSINEDETLPITFHHSSRLHDGPQVHVKRHSQVFGLVSHTSRKDYEASSFGWNPARKRREMRDKDMRYLLVHPRTTDPDSGHIRGFLSFMLTHDSVPAVPVLYIYEIHLDDELRKCGLGSHLMRAAEEIARSVGVQKVMLTCFLSNGSARKFYERRGYMADVCSPTPRKIRRKVLEPDYVIMSKDVEK